MSQPPGLRPGVDLPPYTVTAFNSARDSENRIHDDDVARQMGFEGGHVPGTAVFAYLVPRVMDAFGDAWLHGGRIQARFTHPLQGGDIATVTATPQAGEGAVELALTLRNQHGRECAQGMAGLMASQGLSGAVDTFSAASLPDPRPRASEDGLRSLGTLGTIYDVVDPDAMAMFLQSAGDDDARWRGPQAPVHPAFLLRSANTIFSSNVELDPWIHVSSDVSLYTPLHVEDAFEARGRVADVFRRKGHGFVRLDVLIIGPGDAPVMRIEHTVIYDVRAPAPSG